MANYNPRLPSVLGNEWVPAAYEPYVMETGVERGTRITLPASTTPLLGQYALHAEPTGQVLFQVPFMSVYDVGEEDGTGPVRELVVPVSNSSSGGAAAYTLSGAATVTEALAKTSDSGLLFFDNDPASSTLDLAFDTASVVGTISGKRIVNVALLYVAAGDWSQVNTPASTASMMVSLTKASVNVPYGTGVLAPGTGIISEYTTAVEELSFGEINPHALGTPSSTAERLPWRAQELQWLSPASGTPMRVRFTWAGMGGQALYYAALRIRFCEETRRLYGGTHIGSLFGPTPSRTYGTAALNTVVLRTASGHATGATFPAGQYTVTSHIADIGEMSNLLLVPVVAPDLTRPVAQALRQAYPIPGLSGVEIVRPSAPGLPATAGTSQVLPYVAFNTTGNANSHEATHAYGTQVAAPVYLGVTSSQTVGFIGTFTSTLYTYVRFYARRFGDATAPLTVAVQGTSATQSAQITAADFDALPEIAAGWREVTLRLPGTLAHDGNLRPVTWSSPSTPGDRWEVLGANGASANVGSSYLAFFGSLTAGGVGMPFADAAVMLSTEAPAPTGVAVTQGVLPLGTVDLVCADPASCIPTGMAYNQITWGVPPGTAAAYDTFSRTVANGWGIADTGQAWTISGGMSSTYAVANGVATQTITDASARTAVLAPTVSDFTVTALLAWSAPATGGTLDAAILGRWTAAQNHYRFLIRADSTSAAQWSAQIVTVASGVPSALTPAVVVPNSAAGAGASVRVRVEAEGPWLRMRVWPDGQAEPDQWTLTVQDTAHTSGHVGVWTFRGAGNVNVNPVLSVDDFTLTPVASVHGWTEVQRLDEVDQVWETIARITSPGVTSMRDWEARPGAITYYRVRRVNALGFEGAWQTTLTQTPAPGVTGAGDALGLIMLSSNADQAGGSAFAYIETGSSAPDFTPDYAEAGQVTYTYQADRDYPTARHRRERGGMTWTVNVKTGEAPPPLAALENGWRGVRDLAWADLPYVAVRTEGGDRWYANIAVPTGSMRRRTGRYIGMAQIRITQIQGDPEPVDIPWGP